MIKSNPALAGSKIVVIVGPTASGKSDLAIKLAQKFQGEIISADSRQVYKGLDIGTGKVSKKEQKLVPHHLLDIANLKRPATAGFAVAQFQKLGQKTIKEILKRGKLPIIVGGTGLYVDALVFNTAYPEVPPNPKLRAQFGKLTVEQLFEKLKKIDPKRAKSIDPHNPRRLIRALEIIAATQKPISDLKRESPYHVLWLGLNPEDLDKRINARLYARLKQGILTEVKNLRRSGVSWKRLHDLGLEYRWIGEFLQNKITGVEMMTGLERAIRQYAKRQMTWFKKNKKIHWLKEPGEAMRLGRSFLKK
jgi:tRNA dimethylallyltransferase